jgi:2-methylcitrate dehydratase PrpD
VGIACTQPQVTSIASWTADAKGLLSGWPVLTGVEAAQFAQAGVSGRRDILESPGGYCYRVSDIPSPERMRQLVDGLGSTWRFDEKRHELVIKRYPTDGFQLTAVQGILDIVNVRAKREFDAMPRSRLPKLIARVQVRVPLVMAASATMFSKGRREFYERIRNEPDWTYITLLFDGQYPLAAALANRRLTWREYRKDVIFDPVVQALIDKIELIPDLTLGVFGAVARVELGDGRAFESEQDCIADFPFEEKIYIGAEGVLSRRRIAALVEAIDRFESFADVRDFMRIASGQPG